MPKGLFDPMPEVVVTYEDDSSESLFSYYPDELRFTAEEFVGLNRTEALQLRHDRDVRYLRS